MVKSLNLTAGKQTTPTRNCYILRESTLQIHQILNWKGLGVLEEIKRWTTYTCKIPICPPFLVPLFALFFSFSLSLSVLPSSPLSVHISVCSQELTGPCQTEIHRGCRSPLGGHTKEGQEGNNQSQSSLAVPPSRPFFPPFPLPVCCNQPARLHGSSG